MPDFIIHLKERFPRESWPWLLSALRQETNLWSALQSEFGLYAIDNCSLTAEEFTPARLCLLALEYPQPPEELRSASLPPAEHIIPPDQAIRPGSPAPAPVLAKAAYLALQLREQYRANQSWQHLNENRQAVQPLILASLFGMLPRPVDMLASASKFFPAELVVRVFLSQPQPLARQLEQLQLWIDLLPTDQRLSIVRQIYLRNPLLVARQVPSLLAERQTAAVKQHPLLESWQAEIANQLELADLYTFSGDHRQSAGLVAEATKSSRQLQASLAARMARSAQLQGDIQTQLNSWEIAVNLDPQVPAYLAGLVNTLIASGYLDEAGTRLAEGFAILPEAAEDDPDLQVARARLARQAGKIPLARQLASSALATCQVNPPASTPDEIALHAWQELPGLLLDLGLPSLASQSARLALHYQPTDIPLLATLGQAYQASGEFTLSVAAFHLANGLDPESRDLQRRLASALEASEAWDQALNMWVALVENQASPPLADLHALIACAIQANQLEQAAEICQAALEIDPHHGRTHALWAKITAARGEMLEALAYLNTVTQNHPDQPQPWLTLAKIYQDAGQPGKGLEVLRAAATTLPDHAEILLALGEAFLQNNAYTEALPVLQQAAQLSSGQVLQTPEDSAWRVGLYLGKTLHQLGHLKEARQQLEATWAAAPYHPEAGYAYALNALALADYAAALAPLSTYLEQSPAEIEPYLQFARAVLALDSQVNREQLAQAAVYLRQGREIDPLNLESTALLAEVLYLNNDLPAALEMYRLALDSALIQDPAWQIRLNHGFGLTALQMGQIEAALAALQEAAQLDPHNPRMQRSLCEAYEAAGLDHEAINAARQALQLAPSDLDNLLWFADQMQSTGHKSKIDPESARQEAIQALKQASELAPENASILLHLSQLQITHQDFDAARETLIALLNGENGVQPSISHLQQAAANFMQLDDAAQAVRCLERAWQMASDPETLDSSHRFELITALATARQRTGDTNGGLAAIEQALELAPRETLLYLHKANLLITLATDQDEQSEIVLEKTQRALQALEQAVEIDPQNPSTHLQAARLQRALGDLPTALAHAERAVRLYQQHIFSPAKPPTRSLPGSRQTASFHSATQPLAPRKFRVGSPVAAEVTARLLAADLASAMLEFKRAREALEARLSLEDGDLNEHCVFHCMRAELAVQAGDLSRAIEEFINALELAPEHPRVLALQARLVARNAVDLKNLPGNAIAANPIDLLKAATQQMAIDKPLPPTQATWLENDLPSASTWLAVAEAALELRQWDIALKVSQASMASALHEPRTPLAVAQVIIMRAEFQRYAQAFGLQLAAPGSEALSTENAEACQEVLEWSEQSLVQHHQPATTASGKSPASLEYIQRWKLRGEAVFEPSVESTRALGEIASTPEETWAYLLSLEQTGDLVAAGRAAQAYPHHPFILAYLAHLLAETKPRQAQAAIQAAYDVILVADSAAPIAGGQGQADAPRCLHATDIAMIHALMARLLQKTSQQPAHLENAYQHINQALADAPDEPQWQLWAAQIALQLSEMEGDTIQQAASRHLEKAIAGDPTSPVPYRMLGELHLQSADFSQAAEYLEQACELNPDDATGWLMLARVYRHMGDINQAAAKAERAVTLAPNQVEPLLVRGQIALLEENPRGAQNRAQAALHLDPDQPDALCLLARALQLQGHTQEALGTLEKALPIASNPLPLHLERIHLLHQTSGAADALQAIEELGLVYPDAPTRLALEVELLEETGQVQAAIQSAQLALRSQVDSEELPAELAGNLHLRLGRLLGRAGQLDRSLHHLSQALQINPHDIEAHLETGRVHQQRRQHAFALKAYHKAIEIAPNDYRPYFQAGLALKESKDYLGAEKMLRRASELAPDEVSIRRLLGAVVALNLVHNREPAPPEINSLFGHH